MKIKDMGVYHTEWKYTPPARSIQAHALTQTELKTDFTNA